MRQILRAFPSDIVTIDSTNLTGLMFGTKEAMPLAERLPENNIHYCLKLTYDQLPRFAAIRYRFLPPIW